MKKNLFPIFLALISFALYGQKGESINYCDCIDFAEEVDGLLNGTYKRTCDDTIVETGSFVNGKKDGLWKSFSAKGNLIKEVNYLNGKLDGKIIQYYLNGKTKLSGEFLQSKRVGTWTYFTDKNKTILEGKFDSNVPIGIWTAFDKKGKKTVFQYDYSKQKCY